MTHAYFQGYMTKTADNKERLAAAKAKWEAAKKLKAQRKAEAKTLVSESDKAVKSVEKKYPTKPSRGRYGRTSGPHAR